MPAICTITTYSDADFYRGFIYQTTSGAPISLVGNTMRMGVRNNAADIAEVLLLTTENGGIILTDAANGLFTVSISQEQLEQLAPGTYDHSLIRIVGNQQLAMWYGTLVHAAGPSR
jgi:hypothetical protein